MTDKQPNILELIAQLAPLQKNLTPAPPAVSQKLVSNLLEGGTDVRKIAKAVGRHPGFVRQVAAGTASLSAHQIVAVLAYATSGYRHADKV